MSFTHMNSNRDLWALIGALLATFAALVWRPGAKTDAPPDETTAAVTNAEPHAEPTPEPRR